MSNKEFNANTQEQMWTVEQLEPKLLLSADLMPGVHEISGHIEKPGEQKQYEFVVTEKTKFFFDGVNGEKFNWSLKAKEKGLNLSPISLEADAHKFLELLPDTYQLTVDGEDDKTGNYSFRIFGESAALNLNLNEATDLKLTPSTQAVLYKVQLDQGDRLYFDSQTSAVTWSMFDSNAKLIIDKSNLSKGFEATQSGTYWLSVEGNNSKNNVNSSFTLYSTKDSIDVLKLNEKQKVIFNKPYESKKYTFDLNQDQWIAYDQLSQGISDTEWLIEDNTGQIVFSNKQTENAEAALKFLKAGSYNLVFNSLANIQGEITFELKGSSVSEGNIDENNPNLTVGIDSSKFIKIKNKDNDSLALIFDNLVENVELKREGVISKEVFFSNTGVQYYKVYLTKDDVVNVEKKNNLSLLRIFDENGVEVAKSNGNNFQYVSEKSGYYYLGISYSGNDNYLYFEEAENLKDKKDNIIFSYVPYLNNIKEVGDAGGSIATAKEIKLQAYNSLRVEVGNNNTSYADVDFFKINVNSGDQISISTPNGPAIDGYLKIFDKNGNLLKLTDDSPLTYAFNTKGDYYLAFGSYSNRNYNPLVENSAGTGGNKGVIDVYIDLKKTMPLPKVYLVDNQGNLILEENVTQLGLIKQRINKEQEYLLWVSTPETKKNTNSYSVGLTKTVKQEIDVLGTVEQEYNFNSILKKYDINLNVKKAGTYFIKAGMNSGDFSWTLKGIGIETIESNINGAENVGALKPIYLAEGIYQLTVENYDAIGKFNLDFISTDTVLNLDSGSEILINKLEPNEAAFYKIESKYLDEYLFNVDKNNPSLKISIWDQYGKLIVSDVSDDLNLYQDYKQSNLYISIANNSISDTLHDIKFKYVRTEHNQPTVVVKPIYLNQEILETAEQLPRDIKYSFNAEHDGLVTFEFINNIYETVRIVGPEGEIFSGFSGEADKIQAKWLVSGQYFIEFNNKLENTPFNFKINDISQYPILDQNLLKNLSLNVDNYFQVYHFNMNDVYDYSLKFDGGAGNFNFKILSLDGVEIVRGGGETNKVDLFRKELIDDYILIIEANNEVDLNLNFILNSSEKTLNLSEDNSFNYRFDHSYEYKEVEVFVDEAGLYFFNASIFNGGHWTLVDSNGGNEFVPNPSMPSRLSEMEGNAFNETRSFYLGKGVYRLILNGSSNSDARIEIEIKQKEDILELGLFNGELVIPSVKANSGEWFKISDNIYKDFLFKLKQENFDLSLSLFSESGDLIDKIVNPNEIFGLNSDLNNVYVIVNNNSSEEKTNIIFETKNKNRTISLNENLQFEYNEVLDQSGFMFETFESGWVTFKFDSSGVDGFRISKESASIFDGNAEYFNSDEFGLKTLWLERGVYILNFKKSEPKFLNETSLENELNWFEFSISTNENIEKIQLNNNFEIDFLNTDAYRIYEFSVDQFKDYNLSLIEGSSVEYALYTSSGIQVFNGQLDLGGKIENIAEFNRYYDYKNYILVLWSEQQKISILLEEVDSTLPEIPVVSSTSVGESELVISGVSSTTENFEKISLNVEQDGMYFITNLKDDGRLYWGIVGASLITNNDLVNQVYLKKGIYNLIIVNPELVEIGYEFKILPVLKIESEINKQEETVVDSLAAGGTIFYKLTLDQTDELFFRNLSQYNDLKVSLWMEDGSFIDYFGDSVNIFEIYGDAKKQKTIIYLTITNISTESITNFNFIVEDKTKKISLNVDNVFNIHDSQQFFTFKFNVENSGWYGLNYNGLNNYAANIYQVVNGGWLPVSRSLYTDMDFYKLESGNYVIQFYYNYVPNFAMESSPTDLGGGRNLTVNISDVEAPKKISIENQNIAVSEHTQVYEFLVDPDFNYFIDIPELNGSEVSNFTFKLFDEYGRELVYENYYAMWRLPLNEFGKNYWLVIENNNQTEILFNIVKQPKQIHLSVNANENTAYELDLLNDYQGKNIILNIEKSGTYFFELPIDENLQWDLIGLGQQNGFPNRESVLSRSEEFNSNNAVLAFHLSAGTYKLVLRPSQAMHVAFNIIPAAQAVNVLTNTHTVIDQLAAGEVRLFRVYQDYFAVYTESYNQFWLSLISENLGLEFNFWTQNGERLFLDYVNENEIIKLLNTQPYFYISVKNIGSEVQENIEFVVTKEEHIEQVADVEMIQLDQFVSIAGNAISDQLTYEFSTTEDGFIRFDFKQLAYQYIKITGSDGFIFEGSPRTLNSLTGQSLEAFWLRAGQYKLEFKNKIFGKNLEFVVQNQSKLATIVTDESALVTLAAKGGYQFFNLALNNQNDTEYWLHHVITNGQNLSALRYTLYSQDGKKLSNGTLSTLYQALITQGSNNRYILLIENSSNAQIEYQLSLLKKKSSQPQVIELNKTVNDQFLGLEQQKSYTFTINEMTTLKLEQLSLNSSSNNYKLVNSKGLEVILNNNNYLLIADTYYLTVVNDSQPNDRANPFSFKTVAVNKSIDLNLNILTQISYNQGIPDKFLKIYLSEDRLYDLSRNNYQHGGFVIYDLQGNYIKTIEPSYYNYGVGFEVNQTGNYLIRPTSYSDYSGSISFTLTDKAKYLNLAESDFVSGILNTYNSQQKYKIKIENQSLYKVNGNNSNIVFSIKKKDGAGNVYETPLNGGGYFSLESGEYEITLSNTSSSASGYYLQFLDLLKPNNNELQLNQKITVNSANGQKANIQNLDGQAGETWLIDLRNTGSNYHDVLWELYDPSGKRVISSSQSGSQDNSIKYNLIQSGQYTLLIWGYSYNSARATSILVTKPIEVKQTLKIGDQVSSQIAKAGDVHTYTLKLDKATAFIVDAVLGNTNFSIIREDGTVIDTNNYSIQYLTAGNYRFVFSGNRSDTPTYSFKLVDYIAKSSVVNHVENIRSELKVGENLAFIELNTEPNQKYSLDFTTSTGLWYQIVDAYGRILISGNDYNNSNTFIAPNDQAYLIIRRASGSGSAVNAFNVQVVSVLNTVSVLPLGQTANVSMSKLADRAEYTFSMASEGWLVLENIASSDMGITLALRNQNNSQIFSHNNLTFANGLARIYLAAGHYTLSVNSNSDQAATLQFDARIDHIGAYSNVGQTLNTAQELFLKNGQTEINQLQPVTNQRYLYRFILNQGDSFNAILSEAQAGQIRLLDSSGNEVVKGAAGSIQYNATLTGIYYLELKNSTAGTQHITLNRSKGNLTESTDVGNTFATAKELSFKTDTQFKITTTIGDGTNATKDVDLYQIMLVAGEYLNISSYTNSNFLTRIFDSAGNAVYSTSYGGDGYYYTAITTGVYYIGLSGNLNNSYNPLTGENVKDAYTGNNTVILSRQSGLIRPITQFSEEINIPESMTSTENWSGIINTGSSQEFYFEVKSDGLYYLDRIQSTYNSSYSYSVSVLDAQSRVVGTGFNVAYYLKAGVYKYIVNNASYAENFQFKWMNLSAQATVIQQGQSVTLN